MATNYRKLTTWLIGAWFLFALTASGFHLYHTRPDQPPLPILLAVVVPVAIFAVWYMGSGGFRAFVLSLDPRALTMAESWRVAGYTFVVLYFYNTLPGVFALPAGFGDIFIGATASLAASRLAKPSRRTAYLLWQIAGLTDLVLAISLGAGARFLSPGAVTTEPMTLLPLSLIPTFGVPLFIIVHIISIAQARRWPVNARASVKNSSGLSLA